jgi:hypothetical protein
VITSLFYPALAIYASSQTQTLSDSTSRILDAFLAAKSVSGIYTQHDLRNVWGGHTELRIHNDVVPRARCKKEPTLRVERVLIQNPVSDMGVLNHHMLLATLRLEHRILKLVSSRNVPCLQQSDTRCFVLSPLAFWDHSEPALKAESDIFGTMSPSNNVSVAGITVTPHMVLAGRGSNEHVAPNFDFARFLVLSYFFPEEDCLVKSGHSSWQRLLEQAAQGDDLASEEGPPTLLSLEVSLPSLSPK